MSFAGIERISNSCHEKCPLEVTFHLLCPIAGFTSSGDRNELRGFDSRPAIQHQATIQEMFSASKRFLTTNTPEFRMNPTTN